MDEQGEAKRARGAADIENASAVHVYAPCVSIHSMAHRMNSLVEVRGSHDGVKGSLVHLCLHYVRGGTAVSLPFERKFCSGCFSFEA
eukprot:6198568-Pleurochrysis_carterae.AAC.3